MNNAHEFLRYCIHQSAFSGSSTTYEYTIIYNYGDPRLKEYTPRIWKLESNSSYDIVYAIIVSISSILLDINFLNGELYIKWILESGLPEDNIIQNLRFLAKYKNNSELLNNFIESTSIICKDDKLIGHWIDNIDITITRHSNNHDYPGYIKTNIEHLINTNNYCMEHLVNATNHCIEPDLSDDLSEINTKKRKLN